MSTISEDSDTWNSPRRPASAEDEQEDGPIISRIGAAGPPSEDVRLATTSTSGRRSLRSSAHAVTSTKKKKTDELTRLWIDPCM